MQYWNWALEMLSKNYHKIRVPVYLDVLIRKTYRVDGPEQDLWNIRFESQISSKLWTLSYLNWRFLKNGKSYQRNEVENNLEVEIYKKMSSANFQKWL